MLASPNQIKAGRALISWSADDLAKRVGVQKTMISAIETGRSNGSI
ncbi:MAG: transcriptional regulator, partial [Micavibrio aeruginosavorus]